MWFKLFQAVSCLILVSSLTRVKAVFPAPASPSGPHSQCNQWRSGSPSIGKGIVPTIQTMTFTGSGTSIGACGVPYTISQNVVCLWSGSQSQTLVTNDTTPGWVTGASSSNCFQKIWVQYNNKTVVGILTEACPLVVSPKTIDVSSGCSGIYISENMMNELGVTGTTSIELEAWDFLTPASVW